MKLTIPKRVLRIFAGMQVCLSRHKMSRFSSGETTIGNDLNGPYWYKED